MTVQLLLPFLLAGLGLLFTGLLFDAATAHPFFLNIREAIVLVPVLLGLKGNLEMTFAARLSTLANLGLMETHSQVFTAFVSNMALIQTQAVVVSSLAVLLTLVMDAFHGLEVGWDAITVLLATAVSTASLLSFLLATLILIIILIAKRLNVNPDNITTPLAAAFGDLTTLASMMLVGDGLYEAGASPWLYLLLAFFASLAVACTLIAACNTLTRDVLVHGWWAILCAMFIGCVSGEILHKSIRSFPGIALFQPLINGVGGNMSAVQASRISTTLHQETKEKEEDERGMDTFCSPWRAFFSSENDASVARILLLLSLVGHILFFTLIYALPFIGGPYPFTLPVAVSYVGVGVCQVAFLLFLCQWLVRSLWRLRVDPDSSAIPVLTALGDFTGTLLLSLAFLVVSTVFDNIDLTVETHHDPL